MYPYLIFFLVRLSEKKMYRDKPKSLNEMKDAIRAEISLIDQEMLKTVMENTLKRAESCIASDGRHLNSTIFET